MAQVRSTAILCWNLVCCRKCFCAAAECWMRSLNACPHCGTSQFSSTPVSSVTSHVDKAFARRLHDALQSHGIRCWMHEHPPLGHLEIVHRPIEEGIRLCDKVLLCCSQASLTSWWVDEEIQKALMKQEQLRKECGQEMFALIPITLDGYQSSADWWTMSQLKEPFLTSRLAADFTGWENDNAKFETQFGKIIQVLRADAAARPPPPKPRL